MKKFLVIGNPVQHSLSPKLHNYWFKKYNIQGIIVSNTTDSNRKNLSDIKKKYFKE